MTCLNKLLAMLEGSTLENMIFPQATSNVEVDGVPSVAQCRTARGRLEHALKNVLGEGMYVYIYLAVGGAYFLLFV